MPPTQNSGMHLKLRAWEQTTPETPANYHTCSSVPLRLAAESSNREEPAHLSQNQFPGFYVVIDIFYRSIQERLRTSCMVWVQSEMPTRRLTRSLALVIFARFNRLNRLAKDAAQEYPDARKRVAGSREALFGRESSLTSHSIMQKKISPTWSSDNSTSVICGFARSYADHNCPSCSSQQRSGEHKTIQMLTPVSQRTGHLWNTRVMTEC